MHFIKYDPLQIPDDIGAVIQHGTQNLGGHDQTRGLRSDLNVAREQTHVGEGLPEIAEFLVGQRFDGRCVNSPMERKYENV